MALDFNELRKHRKQGADAKARVLARTAAAKAGTHAPASSSAGESKSGIDFDAIRKKIQSGTTPAPIEDTTPTNQLATSRLERNEQRLNDQTPTRATTVPASMTAGGGAKPGTFEGIQHFQETHPVQPSANEQLGNRLKKVPIVGPIIKGLDYLSEKTAPAAKVAQEFYTPGAGLSALSAAEQAGAKLVGRALPGVESALFKASPKAAYVANQYGETAAKALAGAAVGGYAGAGQSLAAHPETGLKGAETGAIGGAIGGAAFPLLGKAASSVISKFRPAAKTVTETLALPAGRPRGNANGVQTPDVITPDYQFKLPYGDEYGAANRAAAAEDLRTINQEIAHLNGKYEAAVNDEFKYLQDTAKKGRTQGNIHTDPTTGKVVGRTGRQSKNEQWYRDFYADKGRAPSKKEMLVLARQRVENGFKANEFGDMAPSWTESNKFHETLSALADVKENLTKSLNEAERKSFLTDVPLKSSENTFEPVKRVAKEVPSPIQEPAPVAPTEPIKEIPKANDSWFNRLFGSSNQGIIAGGANAGREGTGMQIVKNHLSKDGSLLDQGKAAMENLKTNFVSSVNPFKYLGEGVQDVALDARRANNLANNWINEKAVTPEGEVIGNSLKDIGHGVPRGQGNAFDDYLVVRHAKTRVGRGENVYDPKLDMNDVDKLQARREVLEKRHPEFAALGKEIDKYTGNLRRLGQKEFGLISEGQVKAMERANPEYSPMNRQFSPGEKYAHAVGAKRGYSGQKGPIKEVSPTGSVRKIVSPMRSFMEQTGAWMNAGMRNRVMQKIYANIEENPELFKDIAEIVPDTAKHNDLREINKILETDGIEGLTNMLDEQFDNAFTKSKTNKTDNVVTVLNDGVPNKIIIKDPDVFKAIEGLSPQEMNIVIGTLNMMSRATKRGATGALAPLFAAKGLTTDTVQSVIQAKNPLTHVKDLGHAVVSSLADTLPKNTPGVQGLRALAQDFKLTGGEYSAALHGDRALNKSVGSVYREPLLSRKGVTRGVINTVKAPFKAAEGVSNISENLNRMAAYKSELKRGGGVKTPENVRNAMRESQEITTNFSDKGAKTNDIEAIIPYTNAAIQGARRFVRQVAKHPKKTLALTTGTIVLPKLWENAKYADDPDYQKLPARTKYRNLILHKNADGTFVQIPMPPEYEAIGQSVANAVNQLRGKGGAWKDAADAIVNSYTPPLVTGALQGATQGGGFDQSVFGTLGSTVAGPISGYVGNQSFTGAPIVPQRLANNSPYMQKDERTSSLSSWLAGTSVGKALKLSPIKTDYLLKQYGGDLARLGLPQLSTMGGGTRSQALLRNFVVDPTFTNNLSRDYYNKVQAVTNASTDVVDGAPAPTWLTDDVKKLATSRAKGSPAKTLSDLGAEKRSIMAEDISDAEKAVKLRENQRKMNAIYLDVTAQLDKMGVK